MQKADNQNMQASIVVNELLFREESYKIIGAAMEVHKHLGYGFLELVYQEALEYELKLQGIPYIAQAPVTINYKDITLEKYYVADFVIYDQIIVEIKAMAAIDSNAISQVLNYLKGTGFKLGLIFNFGAKSLEWKRIALTKN